MCQIWIYIYKRLYIRYYSQKTSHLNVICQRAFIEHASKAATMISEICMLYMHQLLATYVVVQLTSTCCRLQALREHI
jgi:hypothetical protein